MRKVYLAFLGTGQKKGETYAYNETIYELNGQSASATRFIQAAEIELIGRDYFDRVIIVATEKSQRTSYDGLISALNAVRLNTDIVSPIIIKEDMSPEGQWEWFEKVLQHMNHGDELTVDLTHGYRSIPIVLSTAIYFLQKAKDIRVKAVYYGAYEQNNHQTPIIDMKDFYLINEWAEGVSRLVEDADARKIAELARKSQNLQVNDLNDPDLIQSLNDLTNAVRNVDVHHISQKTEHAIRLIESKSANISLTEKILLDLVVDKFTSLTTQVPTNGYTQNYFRVQFEIIRLLLDHRLFMQAFTVMRELIGSIGLIQEQKNINSCSGKKLRRKAELFIPMIWKREEEWKFTDEDKPIVEKLMPLFSQLETIGVVQELRGFIKELINYRNGFDHAWTSKNGDPADIEEKGHEYYQKLKSVIDTLIGHKLIQE